MTVTIAGTKLVLLPERAISRPEAKSLILADPHFGKADHFRAAGVPIPHGANDATLDRLTRLLEQTAATKLIILGDFWHGPDGVTEKVVEQISSWRRQHASLDVAVVLGNHDRRCPIFPSEWGFNIHTRSIVDPPFAFSHYPDVQPGSYTLAGHLHPAFTVRGNARQGLCLPCFWFGETVGVLPAFGAFTGKFRITPAASDRVFVIAEDEVIEWPGSAG